MGKEDRHVVPLLDTAFRATTGSLAELRTAVEAAANALGLNRGWTDNAKLVACELATNAVEASSGSSYRVTVEKDADDLVITVRNLAGAREVPPPEDWRPTHLLATRGRGLAIVDAIADRVEVVRDAGGWLEVSARLKPFEAG